MGVQGLVYAWVQVYVILSSRVTSLALRGSLYTPCRRCQKG